MPVATLGVGVRDIYCLLDPLFTTAVIDRDHPEWDKSDVIERAEKKIISYGGPVLPALWSALEMRIREESRGWLHLDTNTVESTRLLYVVKSIDAGALPACVQLLFDLGTTADIKQLLHACAHNNISIKCKEPTSVISDKDSVDCHNWFEKELASIIPPPGGPKDYPDFTSRSHRFCELLVGSGPFGLPYAKQIFCIKDHYGLYGILIWHIARNGAKWMLDFLKHQEGIKVDGELLTAFRMCDTGRWSETVELGPRYLVHELKDIRKYVPRNPRG